MGSLSVFHWLLFLFILGFFLLPIWPAWRILKRAGYSGAWSLLIWVPVLNFVMIYVFAFVQWPIERRAY
jgi:hypothetical protein